MGVTCYMELAVGARGQKRQQLVHHYQPTPPPTMMLLPPTFLKEPYRHLRMPRHQRDQYPRFNAFCIEPNPKITITDGGSTAP